MLGYEARPATVRAVVLGRPRFDPGRQTIPNPLPVAQLDDSSPVEAVGAANVWSPR